MKGAKARQQKFIIEYLREHYCTSVVDERFHREFHQKFGGRFLAKAYGAEPVQKAMRMLASLHSQGILERGRISLVEHEPGFPNWVYSYTLSKDWL